MSRHKSLLTSFNKLNEHWYWTSNENDKLFAMVIESFTDSRTRNTTSTKTSAILAKKMRYSRIDAKL